MPSRHKQLTYNLAFHDSAPVSTVRFCLNCKPDLIIFTMKYRHRNSGRLMELHATSGSLRSTALEAALEGGMEEAVKQLEQGASLHKVRGVNKVYPRKFKVDVENMRLLAESRKWWSPSGSAGDGSMETAVSLVDVAEVREGWKTDTFNKVSDHYEKSKKQGESAMPPLDENRCFSIVHGTGGRETLDLMADSEAERKLWTGGLTHLVETFRSLHQDRQYDMWLKSKFEAADKDNNGALNLEEVVKLLEQLNLKMNKLSIRKLFNEANTNNSMRDGQQVLDAQEFVSFYHSLLKMPMVEKLFEQYGDRKSGTMSTEQLRRLCSAEQGLDLSEEEAVRLLQDSELSNAKNRNFLTLDGFYHLLLSDAFNIYNHEHQSNVHQSMDEPLSHYFISSSHNTYLTGHQLAGESSVEGYISALKKGCRVVELDVWDGDDGQPIIYHGHTLTTKITLADVLKDAIKRYAFYASPYPVILSVENHLSIPQQKVMVKLFKEILGDSLLTAPAAENLGELPSPNDLKNKIIIKAKKPQGTEIEDDDEPDDEQQDAIDYIDAEDGAGISKAVNYLKTTVCSLTGAPGETVEPKHHKPMAPELAQVVNVCEGKKFASFAASFLNDKCVHFPSLRENKAKDLMESAPADFIKFTQRQIAKIYPHGTRTSSSNLKTYPFWSVGAQVVTLNMQTEDKPTFYNEALFRCNGNCGYVLKPPILRGLQLYDPNNPGPGTSKVLRVTVLSGQHLPASEKKGDIVDPYVQLKARGHPCDKQKTRTRVVKNNGFNPVWNQELTLRLKVAPVALVYFSVRDDSSMSWDAVLALACIPFSSLQTGYRHVHLTDITGKSLAPSALFVKVAISDS
ncbi:Phosphatidylinositol-specific phospholipase C X domain [Trinorchestia longiramus]|nr:Phosphatidylinositol-specific phospholipase C X domain [Trinorchestia longiramus]